MPRTTENLTREPAQATTVELRQALAGHGIRLPSLGVDAVTYARGWAYPLVSLGNCPLDEATSVLERMRAATPPPITCSVGLATSDGAEPAEAVVRRSDAALYRAKRGGRNMIDTAIG